MKSSEGNRRVSMTKGLIKTALLDLLEQKDLSKVKVTAICERADVHRSTFYKHYSEPGDVLREIEQDFLNEIPKPSQLNNRRDHKKANAAAIAFYDFIQQNEKTFRILFNGETGSNFTAKLVDHLCSKYVPDMNNCDEMTAQFLRLYIVNGVVGMMKEWVYSGFPVSSQKIAEMTFAFSKQVFKISI